MVFLLFAGATYLAVHLHRTHPGWTFILNGVRMALVIGTMGAGRFPIIFASHTDPSHSLTVWDACSSHLTLKIMLIAALLFVPLMIYTAARVYRILKGPVRDDDIKRDGGNMY